jgi:hypothetical protein
LVAYAQSDQAIEDLSDLVAVIKRYAGVAKDVSDSFKMRLQSEDKS